jgi:hypothetical protein
MKGLRQEGGIELMNAKRFIIILGVGAILLLTASIGLASANPSQDAINIEDIQFPAILVITSDLDSFTSLANTHNPASAIESMPSQAP